MQLFLIFYTQEMYGGYNEMFSISIVAPNEVQAKELAQRAWVKIYSVSNRARFKELFNLTENRSIEWKPEG